MASRANIIIDQGADFITNISVTDDNDIPLDLTNFTGSAQMRKHYTSVTFYSFLVNTNSQGEVQLTMHANTSANIAAGRYVYDCELTNLSNGTVSRIVEGIVTVTPSVTR